MAKPLQTAPRKDIKDIWLAYKKTPTQDLRNVLMENYLHLVRYNAERIHVKLPDEVELDDLMSAGIFGLMDAIDAFDLDRGGEIRNVLRAAHPRGDPGRAAVDGLGAAPRAQPGPQDGERDEAARGGAGAVADE